MPGTGGPPPDDDLNKKTYSKESLEKPKTRISPKTKLRDRSALLRRARLRAVSPSLVVELGPGSGVVSTYACALLRGGAWQLAVDLNADACALATRTARANGARPRLDLARGDLLQSLAPRLRGKVDLLLFNPPYVPTPPRELGSEGIEAAWAPTLTASGLSFRFWCWNLLVFFPLFWAMRRRWTRGLSLPPCVGLARASLSLSLVTTPSAGRRRARARRQRLFAFPQNDYDDDSRNLACLSRNAGERSSTDSCRTWPSGSLRAARSTSLSSTRTSPPRSARSYTHRASSPRPSSRAALATSTSPSSAPGARVRVQTRRDKELFLLLLLLLLLLRALDPASCSAYIWCIHPNDGNPDDYHPFSKKKNSYVFVGEKGHQPDPPGHQTYRIIKLFG